MYLSIYLSACLSVYLSIYCVKVSAREVCVRVGAFVYVFIFVRVCMFYKGQRTLAQVDNSFIQK